MIMKTEVLHSEKLENQAQRGWTLMDRAQRIWMLVVQTQRRNQYGLKRETGDQGQETEMDRGSGQGDSG